MDSTRITAGSKSITRMNGFEMRVRRDRKLLTVLVQDVEVGDKIWDGYDWVTVTKVKSKTSGFHERKGKENKQCFPANAKVLTKDGGLVSISDVTTGTSVLALDPSGSPVYSPVYLMTHANPEARLVCVSISAGGKTLELSPGHYLFVVSADGHRREVTAREVKVGDVILVDDMTADFRQASVTSAELVERQGMYAPLTLEGSIVVSDVVCSCYTDACRMAPASAHALLWPLRRLWQLSPAGVAVACKPCDLEGRPALAAWFLDNVLSLLPSGSPP